MVRATSELILAVNTFPAVLPSILRLIFFEGQVTENLPRPRSIAAILNGNGGVAEAASLQCFGPHSTLRFRISGGPNKQGEGGFVGKLKPPLHGQILSNSIMSNHVLLQICRIECPFYTIRFCRIR